MEFYKCHKLSHFQSECLSWEENVNYVEFNEEEYIILMVKSESKGWSKEHI